MKTERLMAGIVLQGHENRKAKFSIGMERKSSRK